MQKIWNQEGILYFFTTLSKLHLHKSQDPKENGLEHHSCLLLVLHLAAIAGKWCACRKQDSQVRLCILAENIPKDLHFWTHLSHLMLCTFSDLRHFHVKNWLFACCLHTPLTQSLLTYFAWRVYSFYSLNLLTNMYICILIVEQMI